MLDGMLNLVCELGMLKNMLLASLAMHERGYDVYQVNVIQ